MEDNMIPESITKKLSEYGQEHVLKYFDELSENQKADLLSQIESTDMSILSAVGAPEALNAKGKISPLKCMELSEIEAGKETYTKTGLDAIKAGKVGAVLLAGGMGTRLGSDNPKGMYNVGLTRELYIFECLINNLMDVVKAADAYIHLFVMTSEKNHEATTAFLKEKNYFGYPEEYIHFFKQEMAPATDYNGKIYLEEKGRMATSPNGNGGWFTSMQRCGLLDLLKKDGVEWINVVSVDNVLQNIADPVFLGATIAKECYAGAKVIAKVNPDERVGAICYRNGRPSVVEYSELTEEMRNAKNAEGEYLYNFGVTLNYLFHISETEEAAKNQLPIHRADKKIKCIDEAGNSVNPEAPNAYKLEYFIFDILEAFDDVLSMECIREHEFAPIKNREGADSLETARALLVARTGIAL